MKYQLITVTTNHDDSELVSCAMFDAGAQGVSVIDREDFADLIKSDVVWDYVDEAVLRAGEEVKVSTVVAEDDDAFLPALRKRLAEMAEHGVRYGEINSSYIDEADWANEWKKYYKPIVTSSVTVVPTWIRYDAAEGERIMRLDPGMAFGTGEHATTRMCLELMGDVGGKSVIDVGCGSGILGIAAAICGARSVYMCDVDAQAVAAAQRNAALNGVECTVEQADLLKGNEKADLVFANITADVLMRLAPDVGNHMEQGGRLVLSGIIADRLDEVAECYAKCGFKTVNSMACDDWRALMLIK